MAKPTSQAKASADIAKRIRSVDELSPYMKALVYGRNGSGKTRLGASAPNVLIIDVNEEGTRSAVGTGAQVIECKKFDEVAHVFWYLKAGNHDYESFSLDTITALQQAAIRKVLGEQENRDPTREPSMPDRRTWGRANQLVTGLLMDFRNLPMHGIFLAQERTVSEDDSEEAAFHCPDLPNGSRMVATSITGIIGRMYSREVTVKNRKTKKSESKWVDLMLVGPHEDYDTKDRTGQLGQVVVRPTVPKLIQAWENRSE